MSEKEIQELVAAEVKAATSQITEKVDSFINEAKATLAALVDAAPKEQEPTAKVVEFKVPEQTIKVGKLNVKFAAPTFVFAKKLYVAEAELDNKELLQALVAQQTVNGEFKPGTLVLA